MSTTWDPQQYLRFADERARPFEDLISRVPVESPASVVDLGCGPGNMTAGLSDRWPGARVLGVDNSPDMIARASERARPGRLEFRLADLTGWEPDSPVDVIVCAATLHWVPDHLALLPAFLDALAPGGCFAFQVPGNFGLPSHVLLHELAVSDRWREVTGRAAGEGPASFEPAEYLEALLGATRTAAVEVWETTYYHVLTGPDPVLAWVKGTSLRPVLEALRESGPGHRPGDEDEFLAAYAAALRAAYPPDPAGRTIFPFRRIFGVTRVS
ncbi:MAG TPA: methyltransferase domain-containing protein [Acidimicrobiales bacterium]|nr:methyltransferase domain-containing protein [Acidimicrobiales bacterium]